MKTVETLVGRVVGRYADHPSRLLQPGILAGNIIPDLLDNLSLPTQTVELPDYNSVLADRIVLPTLRAGLLARTDSWRTGESHGAVVAVGGVKTGSAHPHLFETRRTEHGVRLVFVDPENRVGDRNPLKPAVMILGAVDIPVSPQAPVSLDFIRFKSLVYEDPKGMSLPAQYREAQRLLDYEGLPYAVLSRPESVIYRLLIRPQRRLLQARYATRGQIFRFLEGRQGFIPLEFKLIALRDTLSLFPQFTTVATPEGEKYQRFVEKLQTS